MKKLILITSSFFVCLSTTLSPLQAAAYNPDAVAIKTSVIGVEQKDGVISLGSQGADKTTQLYLLHNISDIPLWLKRVSYDQSQGVQAGWDVLLAGQSYSVLMLNRKSMIFACDLANTDLPAVVDCADYVESARISKQKNTFAQANVGNYWVAESWLKNSTKKNHLAGLKQVLAERNIVVS